MNNYINSKTNKFLKIINKLKHKKYRKELQLYVVEGKKVVEEALKLKKDKVKNIFVSESYAKKNIIEKTSYIIQDDIFEYISEDKNPEGILCIMELEENVEILDTTQNTIVILDNIRDPGNLGNILRTAAGLNLKQIILSSETVDPYMPKVIRSSMGTIFNLNIFELNIVDIIGKLKQEGYNIVTAQMDGKSIFEYTNQKTAVIFGNEANGVSEEIEQVADEHISIPMPGNIESLNVASSVSVILYELYRKGI